MIGPAHYEGWTCNDCEFIRFTTEGIPYAYCNINNAKIDNRDHTPFWCPYLKIYIEREFKNWSGVSKMRHIDGIPLGEYHHWIETCPVCGESMERRQFKNDVVKEYCFHCQHSDEYQLL